MDFRQSKPFSKYLESSGWKTARLSDGTYIYIFNLPLLGAILRIPRPQPPINFKEIDIFAKKYNAILIKIEPDVGTNDLRLTHQLKKNGYNLDSWSIEPTQTLIVDLNQSEQQLIDDIRPKWRQYIRHAQKKGVAIIPSDNIDNFIKIWQQNAANKGYLIEKAAKTRLLWTEFKKLSAAKLLFAYIDKQVVAANFLIFWQQKAYLWHMAYNGKYEKLHPVRLLVWQSMLYAKSLGFRKFDFEGIEDPRLPYTKKLQPTFFKEGFGGSERQYIGSFVKYFNPIYSLPFSLSGKFAPQLFRAVYKKIYG